MPPTLPKPWYWIGSIDKSEREIFSECFAKYFPEYIHCQITDHGGQYICYQVYIATTGYFFKKKYVALPKYWNLAGEYFLNGWNSKIKAPANRG